MSDESSLPDQQTLFDDDHKPFIPEWPDDGMMHRIALVVEVPTGPGVEITAAEVLLDVVQTLTYQNLAPSLTSLRVTSRARPRR